MSYPLIPATTEFRCSSHISLADVGIKIRLLNLLPALKAAPYVWSYGGEVATFISADCFSVSIIFVTGFMFPLRFQYAFMFSGRCVRTSCLM